MSGLSLLLVLLSAIAHAAWNLAGKQARPDLAFFFLASLWGFLLGAPLILPFTWPLLQSMPATLWAWVGLSGLCQALYLWGLGQAYQRGELSSLYPLIRAVPLLLLMLAGLLWQAGNPLSHAALAGILLIVLGCLLLPMRHFGDLRLRHYLNPASAFALLAATATAGYSLVDDIATRALRGLPSAHSAAEVALLYVLLQSLAAAAWLGLPLLRQQAWRRLAGQWRSSLFTGIMMPLTYVLVVWAMAYASHVSYVVALRQVSIPIGVGLGIWLLGEPLSRAKLLGVALVLGGLGLVLLD